MVNKPNALTATATQHHDPLPEGGPLEEVAGVAGVTGSPGQAGQAWLVGQGGQAGIVGCTIREPRPAKKNKPTRDDIQKPAMGIECRQPVHDKQGCYLTTSSNQL